MENNKNRNAQKKHKTKQKQKEMKTHLTKNKVVQKSCLKASPVYTFITILKNKKTTTKTKQTNKRRKKI